MYIEDLKNGKFKYIQTYKDPSTNKTKRISVTKSNKTRATQKAALEELNTRIEGLLNSNPLNQPTSTIVKEYLQLKEKTLTKQTFLTYKKTLELIPKGTLNDLSKIKLEQQIYHLRGAYSYKTIKVKVAILNNFFNYVKKYHCDTFDLNLEYTPSKSEKMKDFDKIKYLEKNQIQSTLDQIKNPTVKCISYIQLHTGMRVGEVLALSPSDIDFENKTIKISKTKTQFDEITPPKTLKSLRTIEVSQEVLNILKDFITKEPYLFNISYNLVRYHLANLGLKSHMFRHTHTALLIEQGVPVKVISERLGHSNTKTTLEIYTHVTKNMKDALRNTLENLSPFYPPHNP